MKVGDSLASKLEVCTILPAAQLKTCVSIPDKARNFLLYSVQTEFGAPQPPNLTIPGALPPGGKAAGREGDHSSPSGAEIINNGLYTSTHFLCLHGVYKETIFTVDSSVISKSVRSLSSYEVETQTIEQP
jgi:hypothetical protein